MGGLAVGAHGYPRTTDHVVFLVGDEAFERRAGGLVTLRLPLIAVGGVRIDLVSLDETEDERDAARTAIGSPVAGGEGVPVVPLALLVYMKLKTGRQRDVADLVELMKRGRIDVDVVETSLEQWGEGLRRRWERVKRLAAEEE